MLSYFLILVSAQAGVISSLSPEELHLANCRPTAEEELAKNGPKAEIEAWKACREKAVTESLNRLIPKLNGIILIKELDIHYADLKKTKPVDYAKVIVASSAQTPKTRIPLERLRDAWVILMDDTSTRANMSNIRSISVRMLPDASIDDDTKTQLEDHLRRELGDLGLKTPASDSQDASGAEIIVQVSPFFEELKPSNTDSKHGRLHNIGIKLKTNSVRFKARGSKGRGFQVGEAHEDAHRSVAIEQAIDGVTEKFAEAFLQILVAETFSKHPIPEP